MKKRDIKVWFSGTSVTLIEEKHINFFFGFYKGIKGTYTWVKGEK
jgi:hypothetical protein